MELFYTSIYSLIQTEQVECSSLPISLLTISTQRNEYECVSYSFSDLITACSDLASCGNKQQVDTVGALLFLNSNRS